jgi:hypothetical protein
LGRASRAETAPETNRRELYLSETGPKPNPNKSKIWLSL